MISGAPVVCGTLGPVRLLRLLRRHDEHRVFAAEALVVIDQSHVLRLLHVHLTDRHRLKQGSDRPPGSRERGRASDLLHALVEELQAGVTVADERALLDKLREHLRLGELGVKLLLRAIT